MQIDLMLAISSTEGAWAQRQNQAVRELIRELKSGLDSDSVHEQSIPSAKEHRGVIDALRTLVVAGVELRMFAALFEILKLWLSERPSCEVTLTYPDGFAIKLSKLTIEAAQQLHQQHVERLAAMRLPPTSES